MHKPEFLKKLSVLAIILGFALLFCGFGVQVIFLAAPGPTHPVDLTPQQDYASIIESQLLYAGAGFLLLGAVLMVAKIWYKRKYHGHSDS